jgi:hypothetical protein
MISPRKVASLAGRRFCGPRGTSALSIAAIMFSTMTSIAFSLPSATCRARLYGRSPARRSVRPLESRLMAASLALVRNFWRAQDSSIQSCRLIPVPAASRVWSSSEARAGICSRWKLTTPVLSVTATCWKALTRNKHDGGCCRFWRSRPMAEHYVGHGNSWVQV